MDKIAIIISIGTGVFLLLVRFFIDRFFKKSDEHNKEITDELKKLNKGLQDMTMQQIVMLEKITRTEIVLEATVRDVGGLKTDVGILKKINELAKK